MARRTTQLDISKEPLAAVVEYYLTSQSKSPRTIKTMRSALNRFLALFGELTDPVSDGDEEEILFTVEDVRAEDLIDYKTTLQDDGLKYETQKTYVAMVRVFLKWLILRQWAHFSSDDLDRAVEAVRYANGRRPAPLPKLPDEDAVQKVLAKAHERTRYDGTDRQIWTASRDAAIVEVLRSTGVRVQELVDMRFGHVHLADGYIVVPAGKGEKERYVFLDDAAQFWLSDWMAEHPDGREDCPVFIRLDHVVKDFNMAMTTESVRRTLAGLCEDAGVKKITPHQFRHRFGTAVYVGAGLGAAADLMGHSDPGITRVYAKLALKQMQGMHGKVDL